MDKLQNSEGFLKNHIKNIQNSVTEEEMKTFSNFESAEEQIKFVNNLPRVQHLNIPLGEGNKNLESAMKLRVDGNSAFKSGDYPAALKLYSRSLMKVPGSDDVAVIVANRSAALYHLGHYQEALEDIELALSSNYPKEMNYKLFDRKARSLLALNQHKEAVDAFRKMLTSLDDAQKLGADRRRKMELDIQIMLAMLEKNKSTSDQQKKKEPALPQILKGRGKKYPSSSCVVDVAQDKEQGRYAFAVEDINPGDVLVVEEPFCAVLLSEQVLTHCFHCFKRLLSLWPCTQCCHVGFCSKKCRDVALASHHKYECQILPNLWSSGASITCLMALRIISQRDIQYFLQMRTKLHSGDAQSEVYRGSDYLSFYNLVTHNAQRETADVFARSVVATYLLRCLEAASYFSGEEAVGDDRRTFIGGLLLRHIQILQFNAHEISEVVIDKSSKKEDCKSVFIGGGVYPTLALFNHSCDPGVTRYFVGRNVVTRAVKPIAKGEMIAENYGPIFTETSRDERRDTLKIRYWFDCSCVPCIENWPKIEDMNENVMRFRCDSGSDCRNVIEVPTSTMEFMVRCQECNAYTNIMKGLKALQDTDSMFRLAFSAEADGEVEKALGKFVEILLILHETLAPPFKDYHVCQQSMRQCMLKLGNQHVVKKHVLSTS